MADTKISALTAATTLADTDELVIASAGASKKITGANLKASMPAPAAGALALLSTTTLASPANFDISAISGSYNDLILVAIVRTSWTSGTADNIVIRFNGDTGSNYIRESYLVSGTAAVVGATETAGYAMCGVAPSATTTANRYGVLELEIPGYASTSRHKSFQFRSFTGGTAAKMDGGAVWAATAAITQVQLQSYNSNFAVGSQLRIYGRT